MKIKFQVHHTYGLHHEDLFSLEELGLEDFEAREIRKDNEQLSKHIRPILWSWTSEHYNHSDAFPSWEVVESDESQEDNQ